MRYLPVLKFAALGFLFSVCPLAIHAQDEPPEGGTEQTEEDAAPDTRNSGQTSSRGSSLPPSREETKQNTNTSESESVEETDPETGEPIETLRQMEVRERVERQLSDYVESLEDFKTGRERDRELIREYLDLTDQILNRWTVPFIGMSLAERAAEKERQAKLVQFEEEGKRRLEAIRQVDKEYYRVRSEDYYETLYQARDNWYNNYEPRNR